MGQWVKASLSNFTLPFPAPIFESAGSNLRPETWTADLGLSTFDFWLFPFFGEPL